MKFAQNHLKLAKIGSGVSQKLTEPSSNGGSILIFTKAENFRQIWSHCLGIKPSQTLDPNVSRRMQK